MLTVQQIATSCRCPLSSVDKNWSIITKALSDAGIRSDLVDIAVAATIAVETARHFEPIDEFGGENYWKRYEGRADLGNTQPGDGIKFHGRGFVQLTGRDNYARASKVVGIDLVVDPNKANDPEIASTLLADFFKNHHVDDAANAGDWHKVRKLVNGGYNGWDFFSSCVRGLLPNAVL